MCNISYSWLYAFHAQVVSTDGATASMVANNCTSNQTPTTLAQSHDGTDIGALLTMTATGIVKQLLQNNYFSDDHLI